MAQKSGALQGLGEAAVFEALDYVVSMRKKAGAGTPTGRPPRAPSSSAKGGRSTKSGRDGYPGVSITASEFDAMFEGFDEQCSFSVDLDFDEIRDDTGDDSSREHQQKCVQIGKRFSSGKPPQHHLADVHSGTTASSSRVGPGPLHRPARHIRGTFSSEQLVQLQSLVVEAIDSRNSSSSFAGGAEVVLQQGRRSKSDPDRLESMLSALSSNVSVWGKQSSSVDTATFSAEELRQVFEVVGRTYDKYTARGDALGLEGAYKLRRSNANAWKRGTKVLPKEKDGEEDDTSTGVGKKGTAVASSDSPPREKKIDGGGKDNKKFGLAALAFLQGK